MVPILRDGDYSHWIQLSMDCMVIGKPEITKFKEVHIQIIHIISIK